MDFLIIGAVAFLASALTFFSGFGLGTVLLPAFALFFPAPTAVAATGAVHLLNNLFKGSLVFRNVHWPTVLKFGIPAIPGAIAGALVLNALSSETCFCWSAFGHEFKPSAAGVVIGFLMILFATLELMPWFQRLSIPPQVMPLGGVTTGFIGGLTGQQGALRSMFLLKSGLDAVHFVATGVFIAVMVDLARLPVYGASFAQGALDLSSREGALITAGVACAFFGAWLGARFLKRTTIVIIRIVVAGLMFLVGLGLIFGVVGA